MTTASLPAATSTAAVLTSGAPNGAAAVVTSDGAAPPSASAPALADPAQEFMTALASALKDAELANVPPAPVLPTIAKESEKDSAESSADDAAVNAAAQVLLLGLADAAGRASMQSADAAPVAPATLRRTIDVAATAIAQSAANVSTEGETEAAPTTNENSADQPLSVSFLAGGFAEALNKSELNKTSHLAISADAQAGARLAMASPSEQRTIAPDRAANTPTIEARVGAHAWTEQIAARVSMLHADGAHAASLRLTPEHLGPLEIQITVKNEQATVWFGASHAETRSALEQALPRLRELLQTQGLTLTDAGVFREPPRDQQRHNQFEYQSNVGDRPMSVEREVRIGVSRRLLDAYA